eukprot:4405-Heterococcus_DN1.PRE.2
MSLQLGYLYYTTADDSCYSNPVSALYPIKQNNFEHWDTEHVVLARCLLRCTTALRIKHTSDSYAQTASVRPSSPNFKTHY